MYNYIIKYKGGFAVNKSAIKNQVLYVVAKVIYESVKKIKYAEKYSEKSENREFYVSKMRTIESQIAESNEKLKYDVSPDDAIMRHIEEIIDSMDLNMNEYFIQIVRTVIGVV